MKSKLLGVPGADEFGGSMGLLRKLGLTKGGFGSLGGLTTKGILGAGGVTSSIILALKNSGVSKIFLSNRTKEKAENLRKIHKDLEIIEWGRITDFDIIINTTSLGLKEEDEIKLDLSKLNSNIVDIKINKREEDFFYMEVDVQVSDSKHFNDLLVSLKLEDAIYKIERV